MSSFVELRTHALNKAVDACPVATDSAKRIFLLATAQAFYDFMIGADQKAELTPKKSNRK